MIKTGTVIAIWFYFILVSIDSISQIDYSYRSHYSEFLDNESNSLLLGFENYNFFRNNEYFGSIAEGYTLVGYALQPSLIYYAGDHIRLKAGVHLQQFHGSTKDPQTIPVLSLQAQLNPYLDVIMGSLRGHIHHNMPEPILSNEEQYFRPIETGMQFLIHSKIIEADVWMDWEQFIFHGDDIPEKFTAGVSSKFHVLNAKSPWKLNIPFMFLATHRGGQISNYEEKMQTLANTSIGLNLGKKINHSFFENYSLNFLFIGYEDVNKANDFEFYSGSAIYPHFLTKTTHGQLMLGYWQGNNYMSAKGNPLFNSISTLESEEYFPNRQLLTSKLVYAHKLKEKITFSVTFEGFYDLNLSQFEYTYGVNLVFSPNFFIAKVNYK